MIGPRWADVVDGLLELLPTIWDSSIKIVDGEPLQKPPPMEYAAVGWEAEGVAGGADQEEEESGWRTRESGEVKITLVIQTGNTGLSASRHRAFGLVAALQNALADDRELNGRFDADTVFALSYSVLTAQNQYGSAYSIVITVHYLIVTMKG